MSYMTYEEFSASCAQFYAISKDIGDTWSLVSQFDQIYLTKHVSTSVNDTANILLEDSIKNENLDENEVENLLQNEDPSEYKPINSCMHDIVTYEYDIIYNISHSVPTLYFQVRSRFGTVYDLDDILSTAVHKNFASQIMFNKWESLTQTEHPIRGVPCYMIHPCKTPLLLEKIGVAVKSAENVERAPVENLVGTYVNKSGLKYLVSWISMIGPVVGLNIDLKYSRVMDK